MIPSLRRYMCTGSLSLRTVHTILTSRQGDEFSFFVFSGTAQTTTNPALLIIDLTRSLSRRQQGR